jgi:hypothetical protein
MTSDELLDAHAKRLKEDAGYVNAWNIVQARPPELRLLFAMNCWARAADQCRALCSAMASIEDAKK